MVEGRGEDARRVAVAGTGEHQRPGDAREESQACAAGRAQHAEDASIAVGRLGGDVHDRARVGSLVDQAAAWPGERRRRREARERVPLGKYE